jgi:hypothetical protein
MNDILRDTLTERADGTEPPPLDLDGIVAAGNQRITRRRALGLLGGAVATAAVAVGGATVIRPRDSQPQPARPAPFARRRVTFALGNKIHYGDDVISVAPHKVTAFVQTDAGFVFLDAGNNIHVVDRSGVRATGKGAWSLTADHHGNLVAWVEGSNDHYESVVYDVAAARELVRTPIGNQVPPNISLAFSPKIVAIDGNQAYFGTLNGLYRWDITTNKGELIAAVSPVAVRTVTAGQFVYQQPLEQPKTGVSLALAETVSAETPARFSGQQAFLSPTATYLATEPDDARPGIQPIWAGLQLFDTTSRMHIALPYKTYFSFYFGQWLDDHTCTMAAERLTPAGQADLIVVDTAAGDVKVVVPNFSKVAFSLKAPRTAPFALPTGRQIIDLG